MISTILSPSFLDTNSYFVREVQQSQRKSLNEFITVLEKGLFHDTIVPKLLTPKKLLEIYVEMNKRSFRNSLKVFQEVPEGAEPALKNPQFILRLQTNERNLR